MRGLRALAVDDEPPALDELTYQLGRSPLVAQVRSASCAQDALQLLDSETFDVVLADIRMPGVNGLEMAETIRAMDHRPAVVFVTAHSEHAIEAFGVGAVGYLLKPFDPQRLEEALNRATEVSEGGRPGDDLMETLAVEQLGRTLIVHRGEVDWVEAAGDYVRVHPGAGEHGHLLRMPISVLEEHWKDHGFARIHRSHLVRLGAVTELRTDGNHMVVVVAGGTELGVSRRHTSSLRQQLFHHAAGQER